MSGLRPVCLHGPWGLLGALAVLLAPSLAHAGNGTHPRTPVLWEPAPACMTIVDRNDSPIVEFVYTIPYEDLVPADSVDEVETSRRHQFLAFCRGHSVQEPLSMWLSQADLDVAADNDPPLIDPATVPADKIFDTNPDWQGCFHRITADADRRLITFAAAAEPVVWDTTDLPVGPYVIDGYTWEPPFNIYSLRNGVVKVIDDPDPAATPPAAAVSNKQGEEIVWQTEMLRIYGCASAMDGSTLTGYWARTDNPVDEQPLEWNAFAADTPVVGDEWELMFAPPLETAGELIALKVTITDPMDRTFDAHMDMLVSVLPGSPPSSESDSDSCGGMGFIAEPGCGSEATGDAASSGDDDTGTGSASAGSGSDGPTEAGESDTGAGSGQEPGAKEGCAGCTLDGSGGASFGWLAALWCVRRRRRAARV
jgi:hypothetical protein